MLIIKRKFCNEYSLESSNCFRIFPSLRKNKFVTMGNVQNTKEIVRNVKFTDPIKIVTLIVSANA
jgi:hypothetical protein